MISPCTAEFEQRYNNIAFYQRAVRDSEDLVGFCPFEPEARRSPRHAPSFERFRFLAKLNTVKLRAPDGHLRRLTPEELAKAEADFGVATKSVTWNALARKLGYRAGTVFDGIDEKKAKADVAASKGCAEGTRTLHEVLGPSGWNAVKDDPALLDEIARVLAFRDDLSRIAEGLEALPGLDPLVRQALTDAAEAGRFGAFRRAGHISPEAARRILPYLREGMVYSEACAAAGYDHTQMRKVGIADIKNPVVQRSLRETLKQVETLIHEFGARPGRIIVELGRDVGKSAEERDEMTRGLEKRTAEKRKRHGELKELLNLSGEPNDEDLRRFELWKEQDYRCIYTNREIHPQDMLSTSNTVQIDHVLPRSRSQDNSYANQVLCFADANQDKGQRAPWEWKVRDGGDDAWWEAFTARVRAMKVKRHKKNILCMTTFDERQRGFVERNINDTRYAGRAVLTALRDLYQDTGEPDPASRGYLGKTTRRLFVRSGTITALLRRAWGLDEVKDRADDRHHALDALICAATPNEWLLNTLTRQYQRLERENRARWVPPVPAPWEGFRDDALAAYDEVFVSRSEKRRGRGQGHKDTIYAKGVENGQSVTYERKAVEKLSGNDLKRLKDADGGNKPLRDALRAWIDAGKPRDAPPTSPKGDPIRKVQLRRTAQSGFDLNGGHVDNAQMVRVDVFASRDGKGRAVFHMVPIYRHQVMDRAGWPHPPNQAITRGKGPDDWDVMGAGHEFLFSAYPDSYLKVTKTDGSVVEGYFRGANRNTNSIAISPHHRRDDTESGIGIRTAQAFRKFEVDRLGRKHEITRETRTWHGAVCT